MKTLLLVIVLFWASFWAWMFHPQNDRSRRDWPHMHLSAHIDESKIDFSKIKGVTTHEVKNGTLPAEIFR